MSRFANTMFFLLLISINIFGGVLSTKPSLSKPVDLTWKFENSTIYWIGIQPFEFTKVIANERDNVWYASNEFCAGEHGGTHLDAPYHFDKDGMKVGDIPLEKLIAPGVVVDISKDVEESGPSTTLEEKHLVEWEKKHGRFENNTVVLVKFGWSQYYPNKTSYLGLNEDENSTLSFPGISAKAAQWLADTNRVVGVGVDTASVDPGFSQTYDAHRILNGKGIYLLENVKLTEQLPARNFVLLVMPMKIAEGSGAPLRLVAVPKNFRKIFS